MRPTRGQVWRFNGGTEGVIASANSMSVSVYVGPVGYMIPIGDVDLVFGRAVQLSSDEYPQPKHGDPGFRRDCRCAVCETAAATRVQLRMAAFTPEFKDSENVTQAEADAAVIEVIATERQPQPGTIVAEQKSSRRGGKRKHNPEVK